MSTSDSPLRSDQYTVQDFGDRAVLVTCADRELRARAARVLRAEFGDHAVRSGMSSVLVEVARPQEGLKDMVVGAVTEPPAGAVAAGVPDRTVWIDVRYDGVDLDDCSRLLGTTAYALGAAHAAQVWQVAMIGFAPGFAYLVPVGAATADWSVLPRRRSPRPQVTPGSVAVAAGMSAVYPGAMPGGWQLIGHTDVAMFDPLNDEHPALVAEGDLVRFRA